MEQQQNPFWQFSVSVYGKEKVAAECIALQDTLGIDVNRLLYCAWIGSQRSHVLNDAEHELIEKTVAHWQLAVVGPLRSVRRELKKSAAPGKDEEKLRKALSGIELLAEEIEQWRLYRITDLLGEFTGDFSPAAAARKNVTTFLKKYTTNLTPNILAEALICAAVSYSAGA